MWKKRFTGWKRTGKQPVEFAELVEHRGAARHGVFLWSGARVALAGASKADAVALSQLDCDKVYAFPCLAPNGASMKCDVCGLEYGLSHNCPGPLSAAGLDILTAGLQAPTDGGIGYYLGEVGKILHWDDEAIRRNAKDPRATMYGVIFWFAAILIIQLSPRIVGHNPQIPATRQLPLLFGIVAGLAFGAVGMVALTLLQAGLCYLIAKWFLEGKGKFVEVMRPLMLVWFVNCLALIPGYGMFYAAGV
jgi:hypothetical protein